MTTAYHLAQFGAALTWESIPKQVGYRARLCLLDMLGATLAGSTGPTAELGDALADRYGGAESSQLIGRSRRTNAPLAALANGMACHSLELDDGHRYAVGLHNGCTTIPAVLAVAEEENAILSRALTALVLGYEIAGRIGSAMSPAHRQLGFHATGTLGVFGAAAGAAYLRGLDAERIARALGIAGSASAGVFEFLSDGSTSKHFHGGHAAMSGVLAADLAAGGMTGPMSILEGREGIFHAFGRDVDPERVTRGLGQQFDIENGYFKLHAACGHIFSPIDAVRELRQQAGPSAQVEQMVVRTYHAGAILNQRHPHNKAAAKFSIPYCVAAAWVHGRATEDMFADRFLADPEILQLSERVDCLEDPDMEADFPRTRGARVEVALRDGRRLESYVDIPRGMPEHPATEDELVAKFRGLVAPILGEAGARGLMDLVLGGIEEPVRELVARTLPS